MPVKSACVKEEKTDLVQSNRTTFIPKSTPTKLFNLCDHGNFELIYDANCHMLNLVTS